MKILTAEFIRSCVGPEQFLKGDLQIAFIGRSNVGKSSLINSLLQRKGLAKVSRTPGKTRLVNLFRITSDDPRLSHFVLVDLPGYGYAKVSKAMRSQWAPLIEQYLDANEQLHAVVVLVESRVLSEQDQQTIAWLSSVGRSPIVVATKDVGRCRSHRTSAAQSPRQRHQVFSSRWIYHITPIYHIRPAGAGSSDR